MSQCPTPHHRQNLFYQTLDNPVKRHYLPGWWSISLSDNARPLRSSDPGAPSFALLVFSASARDANMQSDEDIILGRKSH
ncbi:hypothetical protein OIU78_012150, partial [Salix suchowensis]